MAALWRLSAYVQRQKRRLWGLNNLLKYMQEVVVLDVTQDVSKPRAVYFLWFRAWLLYIGAPLVAQTLKCLYAVWETQVRSLGWEDPLEKEIAAHSSTLAWKIPWTEEPGRLQSMGLQRVRQDWATSLFSFYYTFSFLGNSSLLNNIYPRSSLTTCDFAPAFIQPTCLLSISFMPVPVQELGYRCVMMMGSPPPDWLWESLGLNPENSLLLSLQGASAGLGCVVGPSSPGGAVYSSAQDVSSMVACRCPVAESCQTGCLMWHFHCSGLD